MSSGQHPQGQLWRDAGVALSLANLFFFSVWNAYYDVVYFQPYFQKDLRPGRDYVALILDVLLLAAVFWLAAVLVRRFVSSAVHAVARVGFLLTLLVPLHGVYRLMEQRGMLAPPEFLWRGLAEPGRLVLAVALGVGGLYVVFRWRERLARGASYILLLFLPFVLVTFWQAFAAAWNAPSPGQMASSRLAPRLPQAKQPAEPPHRVVWMVFDALDQRLLFEDRPAGLALPALDRLREQSVYASRAYPPAPGTLLSLPAFLTGRPVAHAEPQGAAELELTFASNETARWSQYPNVFSRARRAGMNVGLAGWLHPYCRLFEKSLVACAWVPFRGTGETRNLLDRLRDHVLLLFETFPYGERFLRADPWELDLYPTRRHRQDHLEKFLLIREQAFTMAADAGLGLVFVHWPIPHDPGIFNRRAGRLGAPPDPEQWYLDNLALVDRTLSALRRVLERAGLWQHTTVLVTSDHAWSYSVQLDGKKDARVPFLLKLPGQQEKAEFREKFSAVIAADLLLAVQQGEIESAKEVVQWLAEHKGGAAVRGTGRP